jgi:Fic family protein
VKHPKPPIQFDDLFLDDELLSDAVRLSRSNTVLELCAKHRPWRKVRPIVTDTGDDPETIWRAIKIIRYQQFRKLPIVRSEGGSFGFCEHPSLNESLHEIDLQVGGGGPGAFDESRGILGDSTFRAKFTVRSLMQEAIESSRLEGAVTTHVQATELLRSQRAPQTNHERMVVNNFAAMQQIKDMLDRPLSVEMLCQIQRTVTEGTLEHEDQAGRVRRVDEDVRIVDGRTSETVFIPPPASGLEDRLETICAFANNTHTGREFIHPILKACILHFMIGYEHPFADGNGRTARAVFYWHALKSGYQVFEYLVISELLRNAYSQYTMAYLDSELDDGDLTYFIRFKLGIIVRAIKKLGEYVNEEEEKVQRAIRMASLDPSLNLRQRLLLGHAMGHPRTVYTVKSHAISNRITHATARADLDRLAEKGLLTTYKAGRQVNYVAQPSLHKKLALDG